MASMAVYVQNGIEYTIDDPTVANVFLEDIDYPAGAYVKIGGGLRKFTTAHPAGPWIGTDAVSVDVCSEIGGLRSDIGGIQSDIGDDISCTPELISGDRYRFIFNVNSGS